MCPGFKFFAAWTNDQGERLSGYFFVNGGRQAGWKAEGAYAYNPETGDHAEQAWWVYDKLGSTDIERQPTWYDENHSGVRFGYSAAQQEFMDTGLAQGRKTMEPYGMFALGAFAAAYAVPAFAGAVAGNALSRAVPAVVNFTRSITQRYAPQIAATTATIELVDVTTTLASGEDLWTLALGPLDELVGGIRWADRTLDARAGGRAVDDVTPPHGARSPHGGGIPDNWRVLHTESADEVNRRMIAADPRVLPPWKADTSVATVEIPEGQTFEMVMSLRQYDGHMRGFHVVGNWATTENVTSQAFARNDLAILEQFKSDVPFVVTVRATERQTVRYGVVGAQQGYLGGAAQVEIINPALFEIVGPFRSLPR